MALALHINVDLFPSAIEVLSFTKETVTFRTKEIIPFWGDYEVVELPITSKQYECLSAMLNDPDTAWLHEDAIDGLLMKACRVIRTKMSEYVTELLNCECVRLGNTPFVDAFQR